MFEVLGKNIKLQEFVENDADFEIYYHWIRDYETIRFIGRREYLLSVDKDDIREYIRRLNKSPKDCFFKAIYNEKFIGTLKIGHINWETQTADMGIMIGAENMRGKGLSYGIMAVGVAYAFEKLGLRKLTGGCAQQNGPMQKCFEKCGFLKEGCERQSLYIEGQYQDHIWYGILREEYERGQHAGL